MEIRIKISEKIVIFILNMPNCGAVDPSASQLKIICNKEPSISLQNVKKICQGVFFFKEVIG